MKLACPNCLAINESDMLETKCTYHGYMKQPPEPNEYSFICPECDEANADEDWIDVCNCVDCGAEYLDGDEHHCEDANDNA